MGRKISLGQRMEQIGSEEPETLRTKPPQVGALQQRPTPPTKRNRDWEAKQKAAGNVTRGYRDIPDELHEWVKSQAIQLGVTQGEFVRLLLEYARPEYENGEIEAQVFLEDGRLTLFPNDPKTAREIR